MAGFKLGSSSVGSDHANNCATTPALIKIGTKIKREIIKKKFCLAHGKRDPNITYLKFSYFVDERF